MHNADTKQKDAKEGLKVQRKAFSGRDFSEYFEESIVLCALPSQKVLWKTSADFLVCSKSNATESFQEGDV
eukprot:2992821-Rhodomonas_salina.2